MEKFLQRFSQGFGKNYFFDDSLKWISPGPFTSAGGRAGFLTGQERHFLRCVKLDLVASRSDIDSVFAADDPRPFGRQRRVRRPKRHVSVRNQDAVQFDGAADLVLDEALIATTEHGDRENGKNPVMACHE
jgi:hypothetical protein